MLKDEDKDEEKKSTSSTASVPDLSDEAYEQFQPSHPIENIKMSETPEEGSVATTPSIQGSEHRVEPEAREMVDGATDGEVREKAKKIEAPLYQRESFRS